MANDHKPQTPENLTGEMAASINPENIIFAEYASGGAMGACGTAHAYVLEGETLHYYTCTVYTKDKSLVDGYDVLTSLLEKAYKDGVLDYYYGGFGNYVYRKKGLVFGRDDEECALIYHGDVDHYIYTSVKGVYLQIVDAFTGAQ